MGSFVLKNKNKQTVRAFRWQNPTLTLVYRHDEGRIEAVNSLDDLDEQEVDYTVLVTTTQAEVQKKTVSVGSFGFISYQEEDGAVSPSFSLDEEKDSFGGTLRASAAGHIGILGVLMIISFIVNRYFTEKKQEVVVTIQTTPPPLKELEPKKQVKTVKMAEKIIPKKILPQEKISNVTKHVPPHPKKVTVAKKIPIKKNIPMNTQGPKIEQMGALAALNAVKKGSAMSLNLNGVGTGRGGSGHGGLGYGGNGAGGGGLGEGLKGGASGALPGKGLIASSPGTGSQAAGAGGYGSNGNGGGFAAVGGAISFRGKSGGFMVPLADEATVEAGLDRDQINAVVQKNMGQIIYCYEMGLQGKPNLKGRLTAQWVISGRGLVNTSNVAHSSVGDNKVENCITSKIKTWKFPKPVGGVNVDVTYPFELRRVSQR